MIPLLMTLLAASNVGHVKITLTILPPPPSVQEIAVGLYDVSAGGGRYLVSDPEGKFAKEKMVVMVEEWKPRIVDMPLTAIALVWPKGVSQDEMIAKMFPTSKGVLCSNLGTLRARQVSTEVRSE